MSGPYRGLAEHLDGLAGSGSLGGVNDAAKCVSTPTREAKMSVSDPVNHPSHYGGADNPYEAIKVIEAWGLGFNLGNTVKYISRERSKGASLEDLRKGRWYLDREIDNRVGVRKPQPQPQQQAEQRQDQWASNGPLDVRYQGRLVAFNVAMSVLAEARSDIAGSPLSGADKAQIGVVVDAIERRFRECCMQPVPPRDA